MARGGRWLTGAICGPVLVVAVDALHAAAAVRGGRLGMATSPGFAAACAGHARSCAADGDRVRLVTAVRRRVGRDGPRQPAGLARVSVHRRRVWHPSGAVAGAALYRLAARLVVADRR